MKYVLAALRAAKPMLEIKIEDLDANPYLLNTEAGTLDLRDGVSSLRPHDPMDYITKITKCSPSEEGMDLWKEQLEKTALLSAADKTIRQYHYCKNTIKYNFVQFNTICLVAVFSYIRPAVRGRKNSP